jgi:hypothetical protein
LQSFEERLKNDEVDRKNELEYLEYQGKHLETIMKNMDLNS